MIRAGNGHARPKRAPRLARVRKKFSFAGLRCNELNRIFRDRYGWNIPNDDGGRDDIEIMLHHMARRDPDAIAMRKWIKAYAEWMADDEATALVARIIAKPLRFRADTLAKRLNLTEADRTRLGIRTIGAVDMTKEERAQRHKIEAKERARRNRKARGAKSRAESINQTKPWLAMGIKSKATYYRHLAKLKRETGAITIKAAFCSHG
jgi:hypothetical protein